MTEPDPPATQPAAIEVRAVEPEDYAALQAIYAQPLAVTGTLQMPFTPRATWRKRTAEPQRDGYHLVACIDDTVVGSLGLHINASPRQRHIGEIGMGVHDAWHGQGVGRALMRAGLELADQWLNLHRVQLTVFVDNSVAIALYQSCGFNTEGTLIDFAFRNGSYVNAYSMARLRPAVTLASGAP